MNLALISDISGVNGPDILGVGIFLGWANGHPDFLQYGWYLHWTGGCENLHPNLVHDVPNLHFGWT